MVDYEERGRCEAVSFFKHVNKGRGHLVSGIAKT